MANRSTFKIVYSDEKYLDALYMISREQFHVITRFYKGPGEPTYKEVAMFLGIPIGTVRSRLNRGRARILKWRAEQALKDTL